MRLNFLSHSLRRLRLRRHVLLSQKLWPPSRWSCKAYKLYCSAGLCLPGKSIFARPKLSHLLGPKLFVLSLMVKVLLAVACQLVYSWLHSDDIMELLLLLILQHRQKKPLPCHMIYTYNTNLIKLQGRRGNPKNLIIIMHKQEV